MDAVSAERIGVPFTDGLGPMQRWQRDSQDAGTLGVIVQRLADGERLREICRWRGWPHGRVLEWLADDEDRCGRYRRAKALGSEADIDRAQEVADASDEPKLIVDTIFRRAEAHAPEIYGRRLKVEKSVSVVADAGLLGTMGALLERVQRPAGIPAERVLNAVPVAATATDATV